MTKIERHTEDIEQPQSYNECSNQMVYKSKLLEVYVLNPKIMSVGEDNNQQTNSSKKAKLI